MRVSTAEAESSSSSRDLPVGAAAPLAEDDRPPLELGHVGQRLLEGEQLVAGRFDVRRDGLENMRVAQQSRARG